MDLGYVFVAQAFGIQLIWRLLYCCWRKPYSVVWDRKEGSNNG